MNRSTLVLIIVLLALGAATYFLLPSEQERSVSEEPPKISLAIDSATVVKIAFQRTTNPVTLENVGGRWMLTVPVHAPADPAAVAELIGKFSAFKTGNIISSNVEKQRIFQVDSTGTLLTFTERTGRSVSLIVGKTGPSYSEVFFRLPDEKDVYLGDGLESSLVAREANAWRQKEIVSLRPDAVKAITYASAGKDYRLLRDSSGWKMGAQPVEMGMMNSTLATLSSLRADGFEDSLTAVPGHPVTVKVQAAEDLTLTLAPADSLRYFVQSSSSSQVYLLNKYAAQQLLRPIEKHAPAEKASSSAAALPVEPTEVAKPSPQRKSASPSKAAVQQPKKSGASTRAAEKQTGTSSLGPIPFVPPRKVVRGKKSPPEKSVAQPPAEQRAEPQVTKEAPPTVKETPPTTMKEQPAKEPQQTSPVKTAPPQMPTLSGEEDGELMVHTVKKGETMPMIAKKYSVSVDMILKWNLLKSIVVKPGQELYIYVRK